ncbi:hypothetical protein EBR21_06620 [bacterium]|nr:hypothetical protein [bacterium]
MECRKKLFANNLDRSLREKFGQRKMWRMMASLMLLLPWLWGVSQSAVAAVLPVVPHQETVVSVNSEVGTVLQFSLPVKTVTAAKMFGISEFSTGVNPAGQKADVRSFVVRPAVNTANESVTFVLAIGKPVVLRFVASAAADKFVDVQVNAPSKAVKGGFLSKEIALMRSMLLDEAGNYSREVRRAQVESAISRTQAQLVRVYRADALTGYVFNIENHGKKELVLEPSIPVLSHLSKSKISPCPIMNTDASCTATVRFVLRGPSDASPTLGVQPFVKSDALITGGEQ